MSALDLDVSEVIDLADALQRFDSSRRRQMRDAMDQIGRDIIDREQTRISSDKFDPDGQPWAPWSDSYAASGRGRSLLERTGRMRRSFHHTATDSSLEVRNTAPYAGYHMSGTRRMPARPFMGWGPEEREIVNNRISEALMGAFR